MIPFSDLNAVPEAVWGLIWGKGGGVNRLDTTIIFVGVNNNCICSCNLIFQEDLVVHIIRMQIKLATVMYSHR